MQSELDKAIPLVVKAEAALAGLNVKDFQELKALKTPSVTLVACMSCVLHLFCTLDTRIGTDKKGKLKEDNNWKACLRLMEKPDKFIEMLNGFKLYVDEGRVPAQNVEAIKPTLDDPDFLPEKLAKVSGAARGVCDWIINISLYYNVVVQVEPMRQAVREAEVELDKAMATKKHFEDLVAELKAKLKVLQDELDKVIKEKEDAEATAAACERKLGFATRLVNALGAEGERWA